LQLSRRQTPNLVAPYPPNDFDPKTPDQKVRLLQSAQSNKYTNRAGRVEGDREREQHNAFPVSNKPTALGQPGFPLESLMSY